MPLIETPPDASTPPSPSEEKSGRILLPRHGEFDHTELVRLLDTIEDERARSRFRESLYISVFVWIAVAWVLFYGPRYLWHSPQLKDPFAVLKQRELTNLQLPIQPKMASGPTAKPVPKPTIDNKTMDKLKAEAPAPRVAPTPPPPAPAQTPPMTATNTPPNVPTPAPNVAPRPAAPLADAPTAQPQRPNFNNAGSAGDQIRSALNSAAHDRSGGNSGVGGRSTGPLNLGGAEMLSDPMGVDFGPYIKRILRDIKRNWDPLIPPEAGSPLYKQGETWIRFSIGPDGTVTAMSLDGSTHDDAINKSCWGSITSEGQFPPLPKEFHGPRLELRIHYLVNKGYTSE